MRRPTILLVLLVLLAAGVGAAGCGGTNPAAPTGTAAVTVPGARPVSISAFAAPEAAFRRYALGNLVATSAGLKRLTGSLTHDHRRAARAAWRATWTAYLHAGLSYSALQDLDQAIDGTPANGQAFAGLHLIEQALWENGDLRSMAADATTMQAQVKQLIAATHNLKMTSLTYTLRPDELLDDARNNLLSGTAVPWSHEGIAGAAAELASAQAIVATLAPMLSERGRTLATIDRALAAAHTALYATRKGHHHRWPTLVHVTPARLHRARLALTAASIAAQQLPRALPSFPAQAAPR